MTIVPTPQDVEILAVKAGISIAQACELAGVSPATFYRWKRGVSGISIENVRKIVTRLNFAILEKEGL